ncbi:hypothetical protein LTR62_001518 [Meristemomyces frigidus]|uniref:Calcofluor white hypersensitive protein n=1 Tax=Meristemomyces frigidus TaxID=1508187 RepID=A0AAN7TK91_9PEZI|nr:hypothetical protein LTR62_001518 [Meristemomyces frigidus]
MSSGRFLQITGGAAVLGVGYYLYNAGGSPKAAEKRMEADLSKAGSSLGLSGKGKEAQKQGEVAVADIGKKADEYMQDAKRGVSKVDSKLEGYRKDAEAKLESTAKDTRANANAAIDSFDKNVEAKATQAKSAVNSWFGGSKGVDGSK